MLLTSNPHPPPAQNGIRDPREYSVVRQSTPSIDSSSAMDSSHRNLPPPSSRTLPPPPPLTGTPPQLPPPPISQWHTQTQAQTPSAADNDSMRLWLQAKAEEDRKKQEEEKARQETLRLEQRVIEHNMLRDALQAGVPPHMVPLIFAGISGGSLSQAALDLTQQYMSHSIGQITASASSSMPPPPQHQHHPNPSSGLDMSSSALPVQPPPPPPPPLQSQQYSYHHHQQQQGMPAELRRNSLYTTQPHIPPPKDTLPSQPLSVPAGSSPIRQSLGHSPFPPSGPPPTSTSLSRFPGSEMQTQHHQMNPNNIQYAPGSSAPPPQPTSSNASNDYQYRSRQSSGPIYFHHWIPPGQSHSTQGGKSSQEANTFAPSHSHSHSHSEYHSPPGRKRKAQGGHQPAPVPSPRQSSPAVGGRKYSQRGNHLRQRSDASGLKKYRAPSEPSNHPTQSSVPLQRDSGSSKGHNQVKPDSSGPESDHSKRDGSQAQQSLKSENNNPQTYDSDYSSRRELSRTPPKTAPVTDDDEPERSTGDR